MVLCSRQLGFLKLDKGMRVNNNTFSEICELRSLVTNGYNRLTITGKPQIEISGFVGQPVAEFLKSGSPGKSRIYGQHEFRFTE